MIKVVWKKKKAAMITTFVVGEIVLAQDMKDKSANSFWWWTLRFNKTKTSYLSREDKRTAITKSGIYYFWVVNCEENEIGPVTMDGYVMWKNPFGHLSAAMWPNYYVCATFHSSIIHSFSSFI